MEIIDLSLKNINFIKTKYTSNYKRSKDLNVYKKNYSIIEKSGKKIIIKLNNVSIPFGYEFYNGQHILNIKFDCSKNNNINNMFSILSSFENELSNNKLFDDADIIKDIENKGYYPNMKKLDDNCFMIRTYIIGSPDIFAIMGNKKFPVASFDIKQKIANVELELGTFWITDNNYGILWYVKTLQILK